MPIVQSVAFKWAFYQKIGVCVCGFIFLYQTILINKYVYGFGNHTIGFGNEPKIEIKYWKKWMVVMKRNQCVISTSCILATILNKLQQQQQQ